MLPPKKFADNPTEATEVKKNGTERLGIDQDGVAKKISAEVLMTKANVGLGNVDNTSDANKPVSTAQQTALNLIDHRIDNILEGQDLDPNKDVELLDSRHSNVSDETYESLGKRLDGIDDAVSPIDERLSGLDTLVYEGKTYMVSKRIENGHLVTTYTEVI